MAVMPDVHCGYGVPIGSVLATKDVVIPNAVGVDIGCGMAALKTNIVDIDKNILKKIIGEVRQTIPVDMNHRGISCKNFEMPNMPDYFADHNYIVVEQYESAKKQLGTLGGGNHFIEFQEDRDRNLWIMIHSGSRNLGYKVAKHYNKLAIDLNKKWFSNVPSEFELAFLPTNSEEGKNYLAEMNYCIDFALKNRTKMMDDIYQIIKKFYPNLICNPTINIAHNYAAFENHFGENVIIHRKGATRAREGEIGIIPGSQGTKSYIVKGKGNPLSFMSCSHGAGRIFGRKEACRTLDLAVEQKKLEDQGIIHSIRTKDDLEEASGAYKNIDEVMENQKDLVEIVTELQPIAVIKG
jgi:tRNA-splicing ligase RtcB